LIQRQINQQNVSGERQVGGGDRSNRIPGERNSDERLELRQTGGNRREFVSIEDENVQGSRGRDVGDDGLHRFVVQSVVGAGDGESRVTSGRRLTTARRNGGRWALTVQRRQRREWRRCRVVALSVHNEGQQSWVGDEPGVPTTSDRSAAVEWV